MLEIGTKKKKKKSYYGVRLINLNEMNIGSFVFLIKKII